MSRLMMPLAVFGLLLCSVVSADEPATDSLKAGDSLGAFHVTKLCGADDDGIEKGQQLCYRCKYQSRPMVLIFARETGGKLTELVKEIDSAVAANEDAELKGLVTLLGEDTSALKATAEKVAQKTGAKKIPFVLSVDNVSGPSNYKLDDASAVTVVVAANSKVVSTHQFKKAGKVDVAAVLKDVEKAINCSERTRIESSKTRP